MFRLLNPGWTDRRFWSVRTNSPVLTSSIRETVTCPTTRISCRRVRPRSWLPLAPPAQHRHDLAARGPERGSQTEGTPAARERPSVKAITRPPTATLTVGRYLSQGEPLDRVHHEERQQEPGDPAEAGERHALGEELAHQPAAGDPQGEPDADLLLPRRRLDQQQAPQVGAHHQHEERGDDRQQQQRAGEGRPGSPARRRAPGRARAAAGAARGGRPAPRRSASWSISAWARSRSTPGARRPKNQTSQAGFSASEPARQTRGEEQGRGLHRHPDRRSPRCAACRGTPGARRRSPRRCGRSG